MRIRLAGLVALAAFAGIAVYAATGFGEESSRGPQGMNHVSVATHRVAAPSFGAAKMVPKARHRRGTALIYKETNRKTLDPGDADYTIGKCPKHSGAVNGYYVPLVGGAFMEGTFPARTNPPRKWHLVIRNTGSVTAVFGIVCVKP